MDNHIYELYIIYPSGADYGDLTAISGATVNPMVGKWLRPYIRADGINAVAYLGTDRHLYEIRLESNWIFSQMI